MKKFAVILFIGVALSIGSATYEKETIEGRCNCGPNINRGFPVNYLQAPPTKIRRVYDKNTGCATGCVGSVLAYTEIELLPSVFLFTLLFIANSAVYSSAVGAAYYFVLMYKKAR